MILNREKSQLHESSNELQRLQQKMKDCMQVPDQRAATNSEWRPEKTTALQLQFQKNIQLFMKSYMQHSDECEVNWTEMGTQMEGIAAEDFKGFYD